MSARAKMTVIPTDPAARREFIQALRADALITEDQARHLLSLKKVPTHLTLHPRTRKAPLALAVVLGLTVGLELLAQQHPSPQVQLWARIAYAVLDTAGLAFFTNRWRKGVPLMLAGLLMLPTVARAELPADAPRAAQDFATYSVPADVPIYVPTPQDCLRMDAGRRWWTGAGMAMGAASASGGLALALDAFRDKRAAQVALGLSSVLLAGGTALAAYLAGDYASTYRERCTARSLLASRM